MEEDQVQDTEHRKWVGGQGSCLGVYPRSEACQTYHWFEGKVVPIPVQKVIRVRKVLTQLPLPLLGEPLVPFPVQKMTLKARLPLVTDLRRRRRRRKIVNLRRLHLDLGAKIQIPQQPAPPLSWRLTTMASAVAPPDTIWWPRNPLPSILQVLDTFNIVDTFDTFQHFWRLSLILSLILSHLLQVLLLPLLTIQRLQ